MQHRNRNPVDVNGDPQATEESPLSYTPGRQEDNENATAYANRTEQEDTTQRGDAGATDRDR